MEVKLAKIINGDFIIGLDDKEKGGISEAALVQIVPSASGSLSIALLPMGFPFEEEITGFVSDDKILHTVKKVPEELKNKYTEAKSNIRIASSSGDGKIIL